MPNPTSGDVRPPWWLKPLNKVFMAGMRMGPANFGGQGPVVLTVPGRTLGQPRSTPITPMHVDDRSDEFEALAGCCAVFRDDAAQ